LSYGFSGKGEEKPWKPFAVHIVSSFLSPTLVSKINDTAAIQPVNVPEKPSGKNKNSRPIPIIKQWRENHPDYWRNWRAEHPKYIERNRIQQQERNRQRTFKIAKMDASKTENFIKSGCYFIIPESFGSAIIAKMDASVQKVRLILDG
jgi:hypothetical protein